MNGKRFFDMMICCLSAAIVILSYIYMEQGIARQGILGAGGAFFIIFLLLALHDSDKAGKRRKNPGRETQGKGRIHSLILLDEEDNEIAEWNIAGKISLLIGRDTRRENVDINLMNTAFAGMVDRQHAVMNYTGGRWYIEDLDSANGIRIQKKDGMIYEVSKGQPCMVEKGDVLIVGLTKLAAL